MLSLSRTGIPSNGPRSRPSCRRWSLACACACAVGSRNSTERSNGSMVAIRCRYISVSRTEVSRPSDIRTWSSGMVAESRFRPGRVSGVAAVARCGARTTPSTTANTRASGMVHHRESPPRLRTGSAHSPRAIRSTADCRLRYRRSRNSGDVSPTDQLWPNGWEERRSVELEAGDAAEVPEFDGAESVLVPGDRGVRGGDDQHDGDGGRWLARFHRPDGPPLLPPAQAAVHDQLPHPLSRICPRPGAGSGIPDLAGAAAFPQRRAAP